MRFFLILICTVISITAAQRTIFRSSNQPVYSETGTKFSTLKQDLRELKRLIPYKKIHRLIRRYLLNDAEFQGVVRTINSYDAFMARMRFQSQPEVISFNIWLRNQFRIADISSSEEDDSFEVHLLNKSPYWSNTVYGWNGFITELLTLYPESSIRQFIDLKVQENGTFAELWHRLNSLQTAFDRFLTFPETQRVIRQLRSQGVDTNQWESLIREHFGWTDNSGVIGRPRGINTPGGIIAPKEITPAGEINSTTDLAIGVA